MGKYDSKNVKKQFFSRNPFIQNDRRFMKFFNDERFKIPGTDEYPEVWYDLEMDPRGPSGITDKFKLFRTVMFLVIFMMFLAFEVGSGLFGVKR